MPGICGIISKNISEAAATPVVKAMLASMRHEKFYESGTYFSSAQGIYAGWLAHENSFADGQVFFNEKKTVALLVAGECFAKPDVKSGLTARGHIFSGRGGDFLPHLYEEQGGRFFENLNGLFSGLLVDRARGNFFLFNDRFGMERIYWHETADAFYFASEAKALLRVLPQLRAFDSEGLAQFMAIGCAWETQTLFKGIKKLPGGARWVFEKGNCRHENYFSPGDWEAQTSLDAGSFQEEFQCVFRRILPGYFASPTKIGVALTGGLDTRMILAGRPPQSSQPVCYTFSGVKSTTLDDRIAARVASACGLPHQLLRLGADFFSEFSAQVDRTVFRTDGNFGVTGAHEIYFHQQARRLADVRLTGNFGSEIFRGVSTARPQFLEADLFAPDFLPRINSAAGFLSAPQNPISFAAFKEIPGNLFGGVAAGRSVVTFRTPYLDNELVALAYRMPLSLRKSSAPSLRLIRAFDRRLAAIPTDRGFGEVNRGPAFWARRFFAEGTFKLDYYYAHGLPARLAPFEPLYQRAMQKIHVAGMHKYLPYRNWFQNELAGYLRESLEQAAEMDGAIWNPHFIRRMAQAHISGKKNYLPEINAVLTIATMNRLLFRELPKEIGREAKIC